MRKPRVCQGRAAGHTFATLAGRITFIGPQDVTQDQGKRKTGQIPNGTVAPHESQRRDDDIQMRRLV